MRHPFCCLFGEGVAGEAGEGAQCWGNDVEVLQCENRIVDNIVTAGTYTHHPFVGNDEEDEWNWRRGGAGDEWLGRHEAGKGRSEMRQAEYEGTRLG